MESQRSVETQTQPIDSRCPYCLGSMEVLSMGCKDCEVQVTAAFPASRLASLSIEHQRFIEMFVLSSGSLKAIAQRAEVSYPTVRSRLDRVIEALRKEVESHREGSATLEDSVEETARLLKRI